MPMLQPAALTWPLIVVLVAITAAVKFKLSLVKPVGVQVTLLAAFALLICAKPILKALTSTAIGINVASIYIAFFMVYSFFKIERASRNGKARQKFVRYSQARASVRAVLFHISKRWGCHRGTRYCPLPSDCWCSSHQ